MQDKIIIVTGVTSSGKSKLCEDLVNKYNHIIIINCDSKQIYKEIPIITAQPSVQEDIHKLYGYVSVKQKYSVTLWLKDLKKEIDDARKNSRQPVITGGSGLYISSLINGLSFMPEISEEVKKNVNELRTIVNKKEFYQLVLSKDPKIRDKIVENDSYRLSRALEVITETGKSIFAWQESGKLHNILENFKIYTILPNREDIYQKINLRFATMIESGVVNEVKDLLNMNLDPNLPAMKAHGVPEIIRHLNGEITLSEAVKIAQINTRHYAKRQYTWFKNQLHNSEIIDCVNKLLNIML